jgi:hypothetical protein
MAAGAAEPANAGAASAEALRAARSVRVIFIVPSFRYGVEAVRREALHDIDPGRNAPQTTISQELSIRFENKKK